MYFTPQCHLRLYISIVKTHKFGIAYQQHTVNDELEELERSRRGAHVTGVENVSASDCDLCVIGVRFWGADLTDNVTEGDLFSSSDWDVLVFDDKKGVGACNTLFLGAIFNFSDALAQTYKFVCVILLPQLFESWVVAQLAPLKALYRLIIQDRHSPVQD